MKPATYHQPGCEVITGFEEMFTYLAALQKRMEERILWRRSLYVKGAALFDAVTRQDLHCLACGPSYGKHE